jgi:hypothetical protein
MLEERERGWGSNNLKLNICVVKKFVMSDEQNTGLRGIVIAGVIGLLGTALSSYLTGQLVKGKIWTQDQEVSKEQLKNKVTVIVDDYEKGELRQMESLLSDFSLQVIDNPGKSTPWRISVVVCPIK